MPAAIEAPRARQRGTILGGEKVVRRASWPAPQAISASTRARFTAESLARIDRAPLPVLAPPDVAPDHTTVTVGPHWYAISTHVDGVTLRVEGSAKARTYPHVEPVPPSHPMREAGGFLGNNEGIWTASFVEGGIAYAFEMECDRSDDPRCADETDTSARIEALVHVGGDRGAVVR